MALIRNMRQKLLAITYFLIKNMQSVYEIQLQVLDHVVHEFREQTESVGDNVVESYRFISA